MNIYYIYFFITLIFFGIIALIYYNFNRNIEKFNVGSAVEGGDEEEGGEGGDEEEGGEGGDEEEVGVSTPEPTTEPTPESSLADTILRDSDIECSWSNTRTPNHECFNKTKNEVCDACPEGTEPSENYGTMGLSCTEVAYCQVNCLSNVIDHFYKDKGESTEEHLGYKIANKNVVFNHLNSQFIEDSKLKMKDENCNRDNICDIADAEVPSCDTDTYPDFKFQTKINYGDNSALLCCKYERLDQERTDMLSCPPGPGECPPVFKHEHFPEDTRDGNRGVKLLVSSNNDGAIATHTWERGGAYAFRKSNYLPVSSLDECPAHDENYSNLNAIGNCTTVGNDAYCCTTGEGNKPAMINGMYPACDLTYVNLLNSVNKSPEVLVTSNIIQMYSGYNLFDTNFYHIVQASNAKTYGFLSNDVFYGCISNDGSVSSICSPTPDENTGEFILLAPEQVSPGITGGDIDENNLNTIKISKLVGDGF